MSEARGVTAATYCARRGKSKHGAAVGKFGGARWAGCGRRFRGLSFSLPFGERLDLRAQKEKDDRRIYLAVECKALSGSFPLVVSRLPRVKEEAFHEIIFSAEPDASSHRSLIGDTAKELRFGWKDSHYERGQPVGKHTVQIGRSTQNEIIIGDAESFDKWSQAIASASDLVGDAGSAHEGRENGYMLSAVLPILVIPDATLWVADYDLDGSLAGLSRQESGAEIFIEKEYWNAYPSLSYTISHLHIFTFSGFGSVPARVRRQWQRLANVVSPTGDREVRRGDIKPRRFELLMASQ